jgi:hypothetical protein
LYLSEIITEFIFIKNKIIKGIGLKDYINNNKLLDIKYYYKYSKNILICISEDNIILIDLDNNYNIYSLYKNNENKDKNIISTIFIDDNNFKIYLYEKNENIFLFYDVNENLEFVNKKEKKNESLKDSSILFLEYYNNSLNFILIGGKFKNKDEYFIYLILIDKLEICKFNNLKLIIKKEKKEILNIKIINDTLYELTKEGIFSFNLGKLSVFELFDYNDKDEIDVDTTIKNLYKIGYHISHEKLYNIFIDFRKKNINKNELIQFFQEEIIQNKEKNNNINLKEIKKENYIKYIEHYQKPNFLNFFIYKNNYLIVYDYSKLYVFDIRTNNIVYLNVNIGRKIKYNYIF